MEMPDNIQSKSASASESDFETTGDSSSSSSSSHKRKAEPDFHQEIHQSIEKVKKLTSKKTELWCVALQLALKKLPFAARKDMKIAITNLVDGRYSSKSDDSTEVKGEPEKATPTISKSKHANKAEPEPNGKSTNVGECVWNGVIKMPDVPAFDALISSIRGNVKHLVFPFALDVVGRIPPENVLKYIGEVQSTNEIALLLLSPKSIDDTNAYKTLVDYLHYSNRYGVIKTRCKLIKDFYVFPLRAGKSMPSVLMPADGKVDLVTYRTDLLLGIIVKKSKPVKLSGK